MENAVRMLYVRESRGFLTAFTVTSANLYQLHNLAVQREYLEVGVQINRKRITCGDRGR